MSNTISSCKHMRTELQQGAGLLVRFEDLHDNAHVMPNVRRLQGAVDSVFGTESTVHLYHATENASRALMPHTDPYDVIVMQLQGSKQWTTCVPGAQTVAPTSDSADPADDGDMASFTDAQLGQLQEIRRQRQQGCTSYTDENLRGMKCSTFTLNEGDTLYLPKGIIHYAIAQEGGSSHITISLERKGLAWADALMFAAANAADIVDNAAFLQHWKQALLAVVNSDKGVRFLEAMPSWNTRSSASRELLCPSPTAAELAADGDGQQKQRQEGFADTFSELCLALAPEVEAAYRAGGDLNGFVGSQEIAMLTQRVCGADVAMAVLDAFCSKHRMPYDVTSAQFRKATTQVCVSVCACACVSVCVSVCVCASARLCLCLCK